MKSNVQNKKKKRSGFTLIELMIVIAILGILMAMLAPSITGYRNAANEIAVEATAANLETAIVAFEYTEDGEIVTVDDYTTQLNDFFDVTDITIAGTAGNNTWGLTHDTTGYILTPPTNAGVDASTTFNVDSIFQPVTTTP